MPPPNPSHRIHRAFEAAPHPAKTYRRPRALTVMRTLLSLVIFAAVVAVAYIGWWFYGAMSLRDGIHEWTAAQVSQGYRAGFAKVEMSGFPWHWVAHLEQPRLADPQSPSAWAWEAPSAVVRASPWRPDWLTLDIAGRQSLDFNTNGRAHRFTGSAEALSLSGEYAANTPWPLSALVKARDLDFTDEDGQRFALERLEASFEQTPDALPPGTSLGMKLDAAGLEVPAMWRLPLGQSMAAVDLAAHVTGTIPMRNYFAESLVQWRDAGGTLEITRLGLDYGPLDMLATGTMALDAALQPVGAFTARLKGLFSTVETLRDQGILRGRDATMIRVVLPAFVVEDPADGRPMLSTPLTLQDRTLYIGPVELLRVPPILWSSEDSR